MARRETKTVKVACFPDGTRYQITFLNGAYYWSRKEGAYPLSAAIETVTERGGSIETIPNPNYRPKTRLF